MLNEAMMRIRFGVLTVLCVAAGAVLTAQAPPAKATIVMVAGCIREQPDKGWRVVNATEPRPSNAVAPPASELPTPPVVGTKQFQLIGVSVFDLPRYRIRRLCSKGCWSLRHRSAASMSRRSSVLHPPVPPRSNGGRSSANRATLTR